jgi:type II secretory pathway component PulJ
MRPEHAPRLAGRQANGHRNAGFTVVELLIAGFILTIVLGLSGVFLARQSDLNRRTQARAEVQDKARMIVQVLSNDLALAGARVYADATGALQSVTPNLGTCPTVSGTTSCLGGFNASGGASTRDEFSVAYITTLMPPSEACREVGYRFNGDDLERVDRGCTGALVNPFSDGGFDTLATNVLALDIKYLCSNGNTLATIPDTSGSCPAGSAYVRSAVVSVLAASDTTVPGAPAQQFEFESSNPLVVGFDNVTCGPDVICAALTQEVLLPNLKDR